MSYDVNNDLSWLRKCEKSIVKEYVGKYVLIRNKKIIDVYNKNIDAISIGNKKYGEGNFLIYHAVNDEFLGILSEHESLLENLSIDDSLII